MVRIEGFVDELGVGKNGYREKVIKGGMLKTTAYTIRE